MKNKSTKIYSTTHKVLAVAASFSALISSAGMAQDLFPAGVESKAAGIESAIASRSAPATLYNPANLSLSPASTKTYVELGAVRARMAYEHPRFDQVYVDVKSPVGTAGVTGSLSSDKLRAGAIIFPTKQGGIQIDGMPQAIGETTHPLTVQNKDQSFKAAVAASWAVTPGFSAGAGLIQSFERRSLTASVIGSGDPLVQQELNNDSSRWIAGIRSEVGGSTFAAAVTTPVRKTYKGFTRLGGESVDEALATTGYEPTVLATGTGLTTGSLTSEFSLNQKLWSTGSSAIREALSIGAQRTDIKDITESAVKISWHANPRWTVSSSYANLPSPWGEGHSASNPSGPSMGVMFGTANGVDRQAIGMMIQGDDIGIAGIELGEFNLGVMNQWGRRTVSSTGANPGHYQLDVMTLTASSTIVF